jgi:NAD(P)-dependent dehydrogenase (short-subunit alcohol dehydrogenase family)
MADAANPNSPDSGPFTLEGKVAIVTGASSGFGAHISELFASRGAHVMAAARRVDRLDALASGNDHITAVGCDVADDAACKALVEATIERHGTVDILVNNAGLSDSQDAIDEPMEDFRYTMNVNLNACFLLSKLVAKPMRAQESGSIVNIASVHGLVGSSPNNQAAYVASKGGLVQLTKELALQWVRFGIRVNAIAPGYFETELTEAMIADEGGAKWISRNTPMRRPGQVHELDGPMLLLASEAGSYITGQTLAVDGGWTSR